MEFLINLFFYSITFVFFNEKTILDIALANHNDIIVKLLEDYMNFGAYVETPKRKPGRPPKKKKDTDNTKKKRKEKYKINNETRMQNLDNPRLESTKHKYTFYINLPLQKPVNSNEIVNFYESNRRNEVKLDLANIENLFSHKTDDLIEEEEDIHDEDDEEVIDEYSDDDLNIEISNPEEVTLENIKDFEPFTNYAIAHTYISKANKGYRIFTVNSKDPQYISFKCQSRNCDFRIDCALGENGYFITNQKEHTCNKPVIIPKENLDKAVLKIGERPELKRKDYNILVHKELGLAEDAIDRQRILRSYNRVFGLIKKKRLQTWGMLEQFIKVIENNGGHGMIDKNDEGKIKFVGFIPDYSVKFMHSEIFFPCSSTRYAFSKWNFWWKPLYNDNYDW